MPVFTHHNFIIHITVFSFGVFDIQVRQGQVPKANTHFSYMAVLLPRAICNCNDSMNTQNNAESTEPWEPKLTFILFSSISSISKSRFNKGQHEQKQSTGLSASPQARS